MPTFTLIPDLKLLNRYLTQSTDEEFNVENPNYQPSPCTVNLDWNVFEDKAAFVDEFMKILSEYLLVDHYDNLLYIVLYVYDIVQQEIALAYEQYDSLKRARELAKLILLLKSTKPGKLNTIAFKRFDASEKIVDTIVNDWISDTIIKALEAKKFPIGQFGTPVLEMLNNEKEPFDSEPVNLEKVKEYASMRLVNPKNRIKKGCVTVASVVLLYLNGETDLRPDDGAFSDNQLNFLFDLVQLLKMLDELAIESEKKDYMRTLIMNYIIRK